MASIATDGAGHFYAVEVQVVQEVDNQFLELHRKMVKSPREDCPVPPSRQDCRPNNETDDRFVIISVRHPG